MYQTTEQRDLSAWPQDDVLQWFESLERHDPTARRSSRHERILQRKSVARSLSKQLADPDQQVRWRAARMLKEAPDPAAIPALLETMDDEYQDVRWVAAEALAALGQTALRPLLNALITRSQSPAFCQSAHHALIELARFFPTDACDEVLHALSQAQPAMTVPLAAANALHHLP